MTGREGESLGRNGKVKEREQMQSLKPVESGQDGEAVWVIKNVGVE
jgi:hypothetical protein